jgi:protoheme IX farnesyltransferase
MTPTISDLLVLMKVRLNSLVVFTTAGGYYMAAGPHTEALALVTSCVATALVASGAAGLNQVSERDVDRRMERTRTRPVAEGRMSPAMGRAISLGLVLAGIAGLLVFANVTAAVLAGITALTYITIYTPMKRRTSLATVVGAVPGALPPIIGWTAAGGLLGQPEPWSLFLLMFFWQLPHFLAISWLYRDDYARAGLPMLAVVDTNGAMTGRQAALWAATLIPITLLPAALRLAGPAYGLGALVMGVALLVVAVRFAMSRTRETARLLFLGSITYLPLLWILMAFSRE